MVHKNSRKKGGDTECPEKLQEKKNKLMESFRALLCVEVSFLFPAMAGIQNLNRLNEIGQFLLLVAFLFMGYAGTVALILSHSADGMKWCAFVSVMTLIVTECWLGIFHITLALLTPESLMKEYIQVNFALFTSNVLMLGICWKNFFQAPECGEETPNGKSRKKDGDTKRLEKLQEQHSKLMELFRSLLSGEVSFLFPVMVGMAQMDKFSERCPHLLLAFLLMGYIGTFALIASHSPDAKRWSALVSFTTLGVTLFWLGIFHITIALLCPEAYLKACNIVNQCLFYGGSLIIGYLWYKFFQPPKS